MSEPASRLSCVPLDRKGRRYGYFVASAEGRRLPYDKEFAIKRATEALEDLGPPSGLR